MKIFYSKKSYRKYLLKIEEHIKNTETIEKKTFKSLNKNEIKKN